MIGFARKSSPPISSAWTMVSVSSRQDVKMMGQWCQLRRRWQRSTPLVSGRRMSIRMTSNFSRAWLKASPPVSAQTTSKFC